MEIYQNKALLLRLRNPAKVTEVIPYSKVIAPDQVLVRWGIDEVQVLKNLSISVPSPIEGRYKWTGKYTPFDHQKSNRCLYDHEQTVILFQRAGYRQDC